MLNSAKTTHNVVDLAVSQHKRIATGDNYISYFGVLTDILQPRFNVVVGYRVGISDLPFPRTKTTVNRAHIVDIKEYPVGITMGDIRNRTVMFLIKRVFYTSMNHFS